MGERTSSSLLPSGPKLPLHKLNPWNEHKQIIVRLCRLWTLRDPDSKVTRHRYNLFLTLDSEIILLPDITIPRPPHILELIENVVEMEQDSPYLIDVMAFLISVTEHPHIEDHHGISHKLVVIKLYSNGIYVHCNLLGNFFNKLKLALISCITHPPILLLEFMKVKASKGVVGLQNVLNCSKVTVNPDIPEIVEFINRVDPLKPYFLDHISVKNSSVLTCFDDQFLQMSQSRTINELKQHDEGGFFNVVGVITSIQNHFDWWYYSCSCGYPIQLSHAEFSWEKCGKKRENVVKNFKVVVGLVDVTGNCVCMLYGHSAEMLFGSKVEAVVAEFETNYQETSRSPYPPFFDNYVGRDVVFKIERRRAGYAPYTNAFNVVSCCCDA
ncbi:hypothetical protein PIB30_016581 [Stylosanthes scabra]|uniref:Uncharacterized protein n=1 Tax=Stylosanthes scabra TaxID=79078 RepID=A0ABU6T8J7_9FABA|nr:hypothetical protein [Stylosanthes scabra]